MKKILFAAALAALLPLFISCGKQNNTQQALDEPRFVQHAGQLVPASGDLESVDFSDSGIYVVGESGGGNANPAAWRPGTKADGSAPAVTYTAGEYDVNGQVYNLKGWGTVEFDNSASGTVAMKYAKSGKNPVSVEATFVKSNPNSGICRSWRVDKTRVSAGNAAADFVGCNFSEIADFFEKNGHSIADDIPEDASISTLSITGAGRIMIVYRNASVDVGSCNVSANTASIDYRWENPNMGYSFETGHATYEFVDGKCILTFQAKLNDSTKASFTMLLSDIER